MSKSFINRWKFFHKNSKHSTYMENVHFIRKFLFIYFCLILKPLVTTITYHWTIYYQYKSINNSNNIIHSISHIKNSLYYHYHYYYYCYDIRIRGWLWIEKNEIAEKYVYTYSSWAGQRANRGLDLTVTSQPPPRMLTFTVWPTDIYGGKKIIISVSRVYVLYIDIQVYILWRDRFKIKVHNIHSN